MEAGMLDGAEVTIERPEGRNMKFALALVLCIGFLLIMRFGVMRTVGGSSHEPSMVASSIACLPEVDVLSALQKLSSARSQEEADRARGTLLAEASRSSRCRKELIAATMRAMDKPNLDLSRDPAMYYVWRDGAELLGDLKAVEALDLLISHLDLSDGLFSTTMSHHPALRGVIKIGEDAIPKLEAVLRQSPDPNMRNYAVYCISAIGGPSAMNVLKLALPSESDRCVNQFIRVSISSLDNKDYRLKENVKWFSAFICNEQQVSEIIRDRSGLHSHAPRL
jgi:hypothetical protein